MVKKAQDASQALDREFADAVDQGVWTGEMKVKLLRKLHEDITGSFDKTKLAGFKKLAKLPQTM